MTNIPNFTTKMFLKRIAEVYKLPNEAIVSFDSQVHKRNFDKGEVVFSEFDEAVNVYFVKSGVVKLTKLDENGKEIIVCIRREGELMAGAGLFNKTDNYPATAEMVEAGELFYLNNKQLEEEIMSNPELAIIIMRNMSANISRMSGTLRDIALLDAHAKTVKTLAQLAKKFGYNETSEENVEIPLTVQEIADLVGSSRETVSRVFSNLKKDGTIIHEKGKIIIPRQCGGIFDV